MAQIIPFPFKKVKKNKEDNQFTEKHILHMIKNIREDQSFLKSENKN